MSKRFAIVEAGKLWRVALGLTGNMESFEALHDVSFDVPKGQFVGVLGRNGAGKSTLLRVIGGVYPADSGSVRINGALSGLYELGIVGNSQATGREYADRLLTVHGFAKRERQRMILDIHEFSELGARFEDPVQTYSAGMAARLYFSTATAGQYSVYLLDEILSVGDQHFQAKCWRRLQDRLAHGASGILVTHDWSAVLKLCQTAHVLDRGRIVFSGASERAARIYLYGDSAVGEMRRDLAAFIKTPPGLISARQGDDLVVPAEIEIFQSCDVCFGFVIERMQPGFGWETVIVTKRPVSVGSRPGRRRVEARVPSLPIEPLTYQISLQLSSPDPGASGQFLLLDSVGWLSGNGIALEVLGESGTQLFHATWSVAAA
ncbi:ABC transporter ATP-binding protein [Bradyrhizobium sp. B117]|uniref:ABC transporter ATP-binding protein n=1 Tax=Bradyrhizobium sp. B117 TaxID=3140246 RepID=UPI00318387C0